MQLKPENYNADLSGCCCKLILETCLKKKMWWREKSPWSFIGELTLRAEAFYDTQQVFWGNAGLCVLAQKLESRQQIHPVRNISGGWFCQTSFKIKHACCRYAEVFSNDSNGVFFSRDFIVSCMFAWVRGKGVFFICPGLCFFLSMKFWLEGKSPVRFSVWLNTLRPRSVSGVSFYFGVDVWCLSFALFWITLWKHLSLG